MKNKWVLLIIAISLLIAFSFPSIPNFMPFGAIALFLAAHFRQKYMAFFLLLFLLIGKDLYLQIQYWLEISEWEGFHKNNWVIYLSYGFYFLIGLKIKGSNIIPKALFGGIIGAVLFFIITNFAVWASGSMYTLNAQGLLLCYEKAIPFFRATFYADLIYTFLFFVSFYLISKNNLVNKPLEHIFINK